MDRRYFLRSSIGNFGKIVLCALIYSTGLVISRIAFSLFGMDSPRFPEQAAESIAGYYLLIGSLILVTGLSLLVQKIQGKYPIRSLVVFLFIFLSFAVNNSVEDALYSSTEDILLMIPILFFPSLLLALAIPLFFHPSAISNRYSAFISDFFKGRTIGQWIWRNLAAVFTFPVVYFVFGIIVSPVVIDYYRQGVADLVLPDVGSIILIQFFRSLLFLIGSYPILILWSGSRKQLIGSLGFALFILVATFEIVLAYELPLVLRVTHSVEILADSMVYSWVVVSILVKNKVLLHKS